MGYLSNKLRFSMLLTLDRFRNYQIKKDLDFLRKAQFFPKHQTSYNQSLKLRRLIKFVYQNIKFYNNYFKDNNLKPTDIKKPEDLKKLPIITKEIFRKNFPHFITYPYVNKKEVFVTHTSGSTATPIEIFVPNRVKKLSVASTYLFFEWAGIRFGDSLLKLWAGNKFNLTNRLVLKFLVNGLLIDAFDLSDMSIHKIYNLILKKKPKYLETYVSSAYALASLLEIYNLRLDIPIAIVSGETLFDFQRQLIRERLNTEVFNRYGTVEFSAIAQECPKHKGLHILEENHIVEILNSENEPVDSGEKGKIIITNLSNYICPFIRYQLDDIGVFSKEKCPCGRDWKMLASVDGRISDVVYSPSGKHLSLFFFNRLFETIGYNYIKEFQIVQKKNTDELIIKIIPGKQYNKNVPRIISEKIKEMDDLFQIQINEVNEIRLETSRKKKFIKII